MGLKIPPKCPNDLLLNFMVNYNFDHFLNFMLFLNFTVHFNFDHFFNFVVKCNFCKLLQNRVEGYWGNGVLASLACGKFEGVYEIEGGS
jgi:hypothetical protein